MLEFLDLVSEYEDEGFPVDAVYLTFQKAFDKVSHSTGFELTRGLRGFNPPSSLVHSIVTPNLLVPAVLLTLPVHFSQFEP